MGLRFDGDKVLLDPYGLAIAVPEVYNRAAALARRQRGMAMKSVVADPGRTTGRAMRRFSGRSAETVIYELHVRGFTRHPSSGVAARGAEPTPG